MEDLTNVQSFSEEILLICLKKRLTKEAKRIVQDFFHIVRVDTEEAKLFVLCTYTHSESVSRKVPVAHTSSLSAV